jgi:hypothetical protein
VARPHWHDYLRDVISALYTHHRNTQAGYLEVPLRCFRHTFTKPFERGDNDYHEARFRLLANVGEQLLESD